MSVLLLSQCAVTNSRIDVNCSSGMTFPVDSVWCLGYSSLFAYGFSCSFMLFWLDWLLHVLDWCTLLDNFRLVIRMEARQCKLIDWSRWNVAFMLQVTIWLPPARFVIFYYRVWLQFEMLDCYVLLPLYWSALILAMSLMYVVGLGVRPQFWP